VIKLPDVTLVAYEVRAHDLMALTMRDAMEKVEFAKAILWTNQTIDSLPDVEQIGVSARTPKIHSALVMWYSMPKYVNTSHILNIEWDSGIHLPEMWDDEFLKYDYVGAPWPWHTNHRIGNGGFSLRSHALMEFLSDHVEQFPVAYPDDDILCRNYRDALIDHGFTWAPEELANKFSFERAAPHKTFGFHGLFNFPTIYGDGYLDRAKLVPETFHARPEWNEMMVNAMAIA
jgi:hypothetical protein